MTTLDAHEQLLAWRREERRRLLQARMAMTVDARQRASAQIIVQLDRLVGDPAGHIVSAYWPLRGEPDLRDWLRSLCARGARCALPVVIHQNSPLQFREWTPGCAMTRGFWDIPVPADGDRLLPDIAIAPVVGFDRMAYRLGYGGGYFDRTLAALDPRPRVIGVGYEIAALDSIHPQPHDIPMNCIVTEQRVLQPNAPRQPSSAAPGIAPAR